MLSHHVIGTLAVSRLTSYPATLPIHKSKVLCGAAFRLFRTIALNAANSQQRLFAARCGGPPLAWFSETFERGAIRAPH
jgi:hypothetical protein